MQTHKIYIKHIVLEYKENFIASLEKDHSIRTGFSPFAKK